MLQLTCKVGHKIKNFAIVYEVHIIFLYASLQYKSLGSKKAKWKNLTYTFTLQVQKI
jgi:hypothetical protein